MKTIGRSVGRSVGRVVLNAVADFCCRRRLIRSIHFKIEKQSPLHQASGEETKEEGGGVPLMPILCLSRGTVRRDAT